MLAQVVERRHTPFLHRFVVVSRQHVGIDELEQHKKWTVWPLNLFDIVVNKEVKTMKQHKLLVRLGLTFGNLLHLSRRGPTSVFRQILKEFEESLHVLVNNAFISFENFLRLSRSVRMHDIPHLHVSMPHVEKLADFLVMLPIFPLTRLATIQGGLASSAVQKLEIRRCSGSAVDAAPEHDCCWSGVKVA
jgi:hypothetical protein